MTPEKLESLSQSEDHLRILRAIDPQSLMGLPLLVRGELLGVLVLISSNPSRTYKPEDLRMAEALAERAALAIENGRLYQTAVNATRLRDEVLGVVAHDLRNPLAAITMAATALRRKGPGGEGRNLKPVESIIRAAGRMNRLIGDLLDVSLIEAGQLGIERARVSTRQLLTDALDAQRPLTASASLEVRLELADDLPDVWGDQHRLFQVIENLIGNAIKFTPAGAASRSAPRRGRARCCSGSPTRAAASRPTIFPTSSTASGRRQGRPSRGGTGAAHHAGDRRGARRAHLGREHAGPR